MIRLIQRRLIIPRGDTGTFTVPLLATASAGDAAVFTVFDPLTHKKIYEELGTLNNNEVHFEFSHNDTVNLPVGKYVWDIKLYKDPVIDENGVFIDGVEVDSYYAAFSLPVCEIRPTGDTLLTADEAPTTILTPESLDILSSTLSTVQRLATEVENNSAIVAEAVTTTTENAASVAEDAESAENSATIASEKADIATNALENIQSAIPTNISAFNNDVGYITAAEAITSEDLNSLLASSETNPASYSHQTGEIIIVDGQLYRVLEDIEVGDTLENNGNVEVITLVDLLVEKADKTDTVLNTTLSRGRRAQMSIGEGSFAFGQNVSATDNYSFAIGIDSYASNVGAVAEGGGTMAEGMLSHAEGTHSMAVGDYSHAEGGQTMASGMSSHAEGIFSAAHGNYSHAEGEGTITAGQSSHVSGKYNISDNTSDWPKWTANTLYHVGDKVVYPHEENGDINYIPQICIVENQDSQYDANKWQNRYEHTYAAIVGNGKDNLNRSNALALDWEGNLFLNGSVYSDCNSSSKNGQKLTTENYIQQKIQALESLISIHDTNPFQYYHEAGEIFIVNGQLYRALENVFPDESIVLDSNVELVSLDLILNDKADKYYTVLYTTLSRGRNNSADLGYGSFAFGDNVIASGSLSFAIGQDTQAIGPKTHAEGSNTIAGGFYAHAEGGGSVTRNDSAHAEGAETFAMGSASHTEGRGTRADGTAQHVSGRYNIYDGQDFSVWTANTAYNVGDKVIRPYDNQTSYYICKTANNDKTFNENKWTQLTYLSHAFIVGNGTAAQRSNAYALDWEGNGKYLGDVYVHANNDSTGGIKLATIEDIPANIVTDSNYVHTDNNYTTAEKEKLSNIATGAEVNVNADWNANSGDAQILNKPTNISAFTNDAGYITSYTETDPTVPAWAKASTKPTYTAAEVGAPTIAEMQQAIANINTMNIHICTASEYNAQTGVPTIASPDASTFYLVPGGNGNNLFIEWAYVDNAWERFGSADVDLSNYVQKTDYATASQAGIMKVNDYGLQMIDSGTRLALQPATVAQIKGQASNYLPIVPTTQDAATFYGLAKAAGDSTQSASSNEVGVYTNGAKEAIRTMIGAANQNIIVISDTTPTDSDTLIWLPATQPASIQIPTVEEMNNTMVSYSVQSNKTESDKAQARDNIRAMRNYGLEQILVNNKGCIQSDSVDQFLPVDSNGNPTISNSGSTILRYVIVPCVPGDSFTIKSSNTANHVRSVLCLGPAEANNESSTGYSRPILKYFSSTSETVYTAPSNAEWMVFQGTQSLINAQSNIYYKNIPYEQKIAALEEAQTIEVNVSGSTPNITAQANHCYLCGTVSELSITPCATGICEFIFTSGSSATVLSGLTNIKMPDWWTGTEANRIYDIMIRNNTYGLVMSWIA